MKNTKLLIPALAALLCVTLSCGFLKDKTFTAASDAPANDFTTPSDGVNVKVVLDKNHTSTGKIGKSGGSVLLTSADGSKFKLDVPANALDSETAITMTAIKTLDGAPLDTNKPTAVQLEPSGLSFNEMLTLTIVPAKEIPVEKQVMFGYNDDGEDYHLLPVDHKSKEIKLKLMHFSAGGVGSASDVAWAATLAIQARDAASRIEHKIGQIYQSERREVLLGESEGGVEWANEIKKASEDYFDQVIRKEMVAAELDCRHARTAVQHLVADEHHRAMISLPERESFQANLEKLLKLGKECKKAAAFQIVGGLDDWQTNSKVCDIMQPFKLTGGGFTMELSGGLSGTYTYSGPMNTHGSGTYTISLPDGLDKPGTMTGAGDGSASGHSRSGTEKYTLTPIESCVSHGPGD